MKQDEDPAEDRVRYVTGKGKTGKKRLHVSFPRRNSLYSGGEGVAR